MADLNTQNTPTFYCLRPRWGCDALYKVYAANSVLSGARVAGVIWSEGAAKHIFHDMYPLFKRWISGKLERRRALEGQYDAMDPGSAEFLAGHHHNFRIDRIAVRDVAFRRKLSMHAGGRNCGIVELDFADGSRQKWIIPDTESPDHVIETLQLALGHIEESGNYTPPGPKKMTPEQRFRMYRAMGVLFAFCAVAILAAPLLRPMSRWQIAGQMVVVVINVLAVIWLVRKARQSRLEMVEAIQSEDTEET